MLRKCCHQRHGQIVRVSPENSQAVFVSVTQDYKICTRCYIRPIWSGGRCFTIIIIIIIYIRIKAMNKECDSGLYCVQGGLQFDVPRSHKPDGDQPNLPEPYEHSIENENFFPSLQIVSVKQSFSESKSFPCYSRNSPH